MRIFPNISENFPWVAHSRRDSATSSKLNMLKYFLQIISLFSNRPWRANYLICKEFCQQGFWCNRHWYWHNPRGRVWPDEWGWGRVTGMMASQCLCKNSPALVCLLFSREMEIEIVRAKHALITFNISFRPELVREELPLTDNCFTFWPEISLKSGSYF